MIAFDPELEMFRGEFVGLNGGADFYAKDINGLKREGEISLRVFLDACAEDGIEPRKSYSGKFVLRLDPKTHEAATAAAIAEGKSLISGLQKQSGKLPRHNRKPAFKRVSISPDY